MFLKRTAALGFALAVAVGTSVHATEWNLPAGYPENNYQTKNLYWFAEQVKEATDGQIKLVIHPGGSLIKLPAIKRAVQTGVVPIGEILLANYGNEDAMFEADMVPFLARGIDEAKKLYDVQKPMLEKRFEAQNMHMLYSVCWPGNGVFSKKKINSIADMKGMRFRAYNSITERMAEKLGAQPVTIQVPELAQAFMTGLADVMIASAPVVVNTKGWDFGKYFYDFEAFHPRNAVIVNKAQWESLANETRAEIEKASQEAEKRGWQLCRQASKSTLQALKTHGMTVVEPDAKMMEAFRSKMTDIVDEWEKRAGPDGTKLRKTLGK